MVYVLAFVVLLMAAAIVTLFAMLGEMYSRLGPAPEPIGPLEEAKTGQRPEVWPKELAALATSDDGLLLVLSTSCASCTQVAVQLRGKFDTLPGRHTGVVLSTADDERAEAFVRDHELPRESVYVDVRGDWVTKSFGVQTSPSALVLRDGELTSAMVFSDISALPSVVGAAKGGK